MLIKRTNGQAVIEFALVLPIFIAIFLVICQLGMMLYDYTTVNNSARDIARFAAVSEKNDAAAIRSDIEAKVKRVLDNMHLTLYEVTYSDVDIELPSGEETVLLTLTMRLQQDALFRDVMPKSFTQSISMYKEGN